MMTTTLHTTATAAADDDDDDGDDDGDDDDGGGGVRTSKIKLRIQLHKILIYFNEVLIGRNIFGYV